MNTQQFFTGSTSNTLTKHTKEQVLCMRVKEMTAEPVKLENDGKEL